MTAQEEKDELEERGGRIGGIPDLPNYNNGKFTLFSFDTLFNIIPY